MIDANTPARFSRRALIAGGSAAGFLSAWPARARAQKTPLRLGAVISDTFGMAYYGRDMGFFERAGFDVEITAFNNGAPMAAAAAGGAIDLGVAEATELANGALRGVPFAIVAAGAMYVSAAPTTLLCVAKTSSFKTARDLEGQTVAVPGLVGLSTAAVYAWIVQNGADISKVHFVEVPITQMADAVARGVVAAAHIPEPTLTARSAEIEVIGKPYDAIAPTFIMSDWFSTRDWVARNRDMAKRFVAAAYETARWANANHDQSLVILAKYAKFDLSSLHNIRRATFATSLDPRLIQPVLDACAKYKMLPRPFNAADLIVQT